MDGTQSGVHFLNLSYFFRAIYETVFGGHGAHVGFSGILVFLSHLWLFVTIMAVLIALVALWVLIYSTMRIYQIRMEEAPQYATISESAEHTRLEHSRWAYVRQLIESPNEMNWRQAIMESDIMLDEMLTRLGYAGETVAEKLKAANPTHFSTLNNAWEAHGVRNRIAHDGSAFQLSETLAYRTIANYEAVFREHHEI